MNALVVGSGGREHALAWRFAQCSSLTVLHAAPGNPGIAELGQCHPVRADDAEGLLDLCRSQRIDLAVIGPEAPLVAGVADKLRHAGVAVFGPSAQAAKIEGSKSFAKEVMAAAGVPTAEELDEPRAPCVLKADGLAAGKGVFVCPTEADVEAALPGVGALGGRFIIEELLEGEEVSIFGLTDGSGNVIALPPAQDAKRLLDGDRGPNTGGMGSYSPVPAFDSERVQELVETIHRPVLEELARRGTPFIGVLYAGLILTENGPYVLEFNCRFGDPETQALAPLLEGDLLASLGGAASGNLGGSRLETGSGAAVTVVLASPGYPEAPQAGIAIEGIPDAEATGALVLHAGTAQRNGQVMSAGGRVLNVTGLGESCAEARAHAYEAVSLINFPGGYYRRDIAERAAHVKA